MGVSEGRFKSFISDISGAFAGSAVILPQSMGLGVALFSVMGYGASEGALAGIIGAAVLCFFSGLFGATRGMLSAPNGPVTMLLISTFAIMASSGVASNEMLMSLSLILVLTGIFQIIFSLFGGAELIKYIPYPVIVGQISAIGVLMIKSQLSVIITPYIDLQDKIFASLPLLTLLFTIVVIFVTHRYFKKLPAVLIGFLSGVLFYQLLRFTFSDVIPQEWVVGIVPTIEHFDLPFDIHNLHALNIELIVTTALALTVLASTDSLVTAIVADSQTNLRHNSSKEIFAQGTAQIVIGLLGGLGGGGTKGATLINLKSGGGRWSTLYSGLFFILLISTLGFLGEYLPISVLAGVIIFVGLGMINFNVLNWLRYKKSRIDGVIALVVFGVTISVDLVSAVAIGILIAMIMYFKMQIKSSIIHMVRDGIHKHSLTVRTDEEKEILNSYGDSIMMFELRGNIFFATADKLLQISEEYIKKDQFLIFNFLRVQYIDISGVILILQIASRMKNAGGELVLCHMHKELGIGKKINKALMRIDKQHSMKIRTFVDSDTSFEYAENALLERHGVLHSDATNFIHLEANSLCRNLSNNLVELIARISIKKESVAGEFIFRQDDDDESLLILLQGQVEIRLYTENEEYKRLAKYSPGTYFGEIAFVSPGKRTASAVALSDTVFLELSRTAVTGLDIAEEREIALGLLFELGSRMASELRESAQEIRRLEQT